MTVLDESGASMLVRSSPTGGASDLKRLYLLIVAGARKTLDIETPYFVPDESTMWALQDAVSRGVRIRILVEGDITDAMPVKYASRASYDKLLSLGISIYEYAPTMMHAKVLVADGALSMFGSANFDNRSLELNEELNVTVTSRELASRFLTDFEQDLKSSRKLELDAWRRRPLLDKTREKFWSRFAKCSDADSVPWSVVRSPSLVERFDTPSELRATNPTNHGPRTTDHGPRIQFSRNGQSPFRPLSNRLPPHWRRADGALQLALRASAAGHVCAAHRGYRR